jgi:hypothetical protein
MINIMQDAFHACGIAEKASDQTLHTSHWSWSKFTNFVIQKVLGGFGFAAVAPPEVFRRISQSFSPGGVTSPFKARAMPTDSTSVVPVSGQ